MIETKFLRLRGGMAAVALLVSGPGAPAPGWGQPIELTEAELFFELNDTDEDLGLHASIDGGPWSRLEIEDPRERILLQVGASGRLASQGLTQLMIESAEPSFEELDPEAFFERFPEGTYEIEITRGRKEAEESVELSHVLAAPPSSVTVSGEDAAESCDDLPLPSAAEPIVIDWDPVTHSHPEVGDPGPVEIVRYQVFVEQGDTKLGIDLPPDVTEFEVPAGLLAAGTVKFEIIARTAALNNTAIESCFERE